MRVCAVLVALLAALALPALAQTPHTHQHSFGDADKWAKVFDDPERDTWQMPHEVIQALALKPGAVVADIGAGTGYFAMRLAHMNAKGRVYAVDLEPDMVKYLAERAKKEGLKNLVAVQGAHDDAKLPAKVDLVLLVDVYHHIGKREAYFGKLAGALKPGGRIVIIDFNAISKTGPPLSQRISPEKVMAEMAVAGFRLALHHDFLPNQYFLVFERTK